jgi:signal transduction histidine kinase
MFLLAQSPFLFAHEQKEDYPRKISITELDTQQLSELYIYRSLNEIDEEKSLEYNLKALEHLPDSSKYSLYLLLHISYFYSQQQNYSVANQYIDSCLAVAKKEESEYYVNQSYLVKGQIAFLQRGIDKCIEWHDKAIKSTSDEFLKNFTKLSLANFYFSEKNDNMGNKLLDEIYHYYQKNKSNIDYRFATQVLILKSYNDTINSLNYITEAKRLIQDEPFSYIHLNIEKQFAELLLKENKEKEALKIYTGLVERCEKTNMSSDLNVLYLSLAKIHNRNKEYQLSQNYLNKIPKSTYQPNFTEYLFSFEMDNYSNLKQYKNAYETSQKRLIFSDSINKTNEELKYVEWAVRYDTEKKEQENRLLKKENQIRSLEIQQQKQFLWAAIAFILASLIFSYVLFRLYRLKEIHRQSLEDQNEFINDQNNQLKKANQTKETFFTLIAHDLINPYNVIMGYSKLLNNHFEDYDDIKKKQLLMKMNNSINHNYTFVKKLLFWAKANQKSISIRKERIFFTNWAKEITQPLTLLFEKKKIKLSIQNSPNIVFLSDKNILGSILFNLVSNAIKFTPQYGMVEVSFECDDYDCFIVVKDNGVGMNQEKIDNLSALTTIHSAPGTQSEKGNGLGFLICYELIKLLEGELIIESKENIGTTVKIKIKK